MKLTDEDRKFLSSLNDDGTPTDIIKLPLASRKQDISRRRAKKNKWASFDRLHWKWKLLPEGRQALKGGE
ncbi:hypothetical protein [Brucella sp. BO2]|uniref:hypothetical protein n=1 Tax=Brucella sp. BO2 TaxID=693750 RepID=UPI0002D71B52|nr:hypothetical protein [Brucella sp. BO2]